MYLLFICTFLLATTQTCHPECRWSCNDPVCSAVCQPVCKPYNCSACIFDPDTNETIECHKIYVGCATRCPPDQCEADSCPQCELLCNSGLCDENDPNCQIVCSQIECDWRCQKPDNCPYPTCQLNCDAPACQATSDGSGDTRRTYNLLFLNRY